MRNWLYVEDHVDALHALWGHGERTNKEMVEAICSALDDLLPAGAPHSRLVTPVTDRPGHDRRYAIEPTRISSELGWHWLLSGLAGMAAAQPAQSRGSCCNDTPSGTAREAKADRQAES